MSDFVPRDILPDLWDEILKRHWSFMETEESIQKIEERKKLEGCLKEFLCIVPQDKKFFLPETAHVLRKSIREMDDFTAYKAIIGFESISQYANNLFTKPWRKEFHVLKMYSGFYQHEVKSNLLDAEKLFEAMGYRRLSDEILILDGPICPDQVTNVSRDAMAAYIECQIMKHIYAGVVAMGLTCTWQEVLQFREKYVGGASQAIKSLSYAIQERRLRKDKLINTENCYATIQHSPQVSNVNAAVSQCPNCAPYHLPPQVHHMQSQLPNVGQCALHSGNGGCALHTKANLMYNGMSAVNGNLMSSYPTSGYHQQQHGFVAPGGNMVTQPHMSHSRSLEHYNEPAVLLPHRHSFDHQQQGCTAHHYQPPSTLGQHVYESPYDCLDGVSVGSSVSYAAVAAPGTTPTIVGANCNVKAAYAHPYNVSGNRYPLPYNISSQLNSHYATPSVTCNGIKGESYSNIADTGYASVQKSHTCGYHQLQQAPPPPPVHQTSSSVPTKDFQSYRQRSFPPDHQLIDFDDHAPLTTHDFHAQMHSMSQCNSFDYDRECDRLYDQHRRSNRANVSATYVQPKDVVCQQQVSGVTSSQLPSSDDMYGSYVYARPVPRSNRIKTSSSTNVTDKYLRNSELMQDCVDNNGKQIHNTELKNSDVGSGSRRKLSTQTNETSDINYESAFDDFVTVGHSEHPAQSSPTQASKNQDGFGSFESWNYVFQNLKSSGYSKDLGDREDLLVQGLDLDSLTLTNGGDSGGGGGGSKGTDRRRSNHVESAKSVRQLNNDVGRARTLERNTTSVSTKESEKRDNSRVGVSNSAKQDKSILKQHNSNANSSAGVKKIKSALKYAAPMSAPVVSDNNNGNNNAPSEPIEEQCGGVRRSVGNRRQVAASVASTQVTVSNPKEWSCRFCTFLNPDVKRICEMCCRSKDFNLEASVSHTPTCV